MRLQLKDFLKRFGVHKALGAYETNPWFLYDDEKEITASAEVRMGPAAHDMEAELQFLYDDPASVGKTNPDQICIMRAQPTTDGKWAMKSAIIKGKEYENQLALWDEKAAAFFLACIQSIQMDKLPDIDALIEKEMSDSDSARGGGRIGRKAPKANMSNLMGMKK